MLTSFGTLDDARAVLQKHFGYPDFRPPQRRAVQSVVSGHDALIVLPTGGGKSLCFQVPALMRDGLTVVISPLISLMKDQVDALERRNLSATFLNSTVSSSEVSTRMARARDGSLKLLYLAPERMDGGRTMQQLVQIGVSLLVVDEAHCISEWGHDFRPSYRRIGHMREGLGTPQTVALTATATPHVRDDIVRQLALREPRIVIGGFDRTNLTYYVSPTRTQMDKDKACVQWLRGIDGPSIVYTPTRKSVERVASMLTRARVNAVAYHAGLDDRLRQRAQNAFMNGQTRVIVATSAFGMGIDKPDVRLVVHHAMPGSLEAYYQEAGRAGRDGHPSTCVLLHSYPDRFTHEFFITSAHPDRALVEQTWRTLRASAATDRLVGLTVDEIVARVPGKTDDRKVGSALRVLAGAGMLALEQAASARVSIRLIATPTRISNELRGDRNFDREVLRTIWRAVGKQFVAGASVDLDGLPPAFGGAMGLIPVLERLESEQFVTWSKTGGGFRLDSRATDPHWLPIDWPLLERRRLADLSRLDAMQKYSQTRACRRAFVLRYFGDPGTRPNCSACDRCLGTTSDLPKRAPVPLGARRSRTRPT